MSTRDLAVLIPARNEAFLKPTIDDVLAHAKANTQVIAVCDGSWPVEPIPDHPAVMLIRTPTPIGQRAAVNLAARLADARYVMKLDAHVALADGFDVTLLAAAEELGPDVTQIPAQKNLHAFDWQCRACGHRSYQGPTPATCSGCAAANGFDQVLVWRPRPGTTTSFWRFDHELHFQYWSAYKQRPEAKGEIVDVMTSLGACFFMSRARFFALGGLDEGHGSWGQFGVEVACASWLTGGRHVVNRRTWFAHLFRTQQGFGFPYPLPGSDQERARAYSRRLWIENRRIGQVRPLSWLIDKFAPIPGWHDHAGEGVLARVTEAGAAFRPAADEAIAC